MEDAAGDRDACFVQDADWRAAGFATKEREFKLMQSRGGQSGIVQFSLIGINIRKGGSQFSIFFIQFLDFV